MYPIIDLLCFLEKFGDNSKDKILHKMLVLSKKKKFEIQKYLWENYKNIKFQDNYFDFLSIVRNGEFYYKNVFPKIYNDLNNNIKVRFFIYENNSTDNTKKILQNLSDKFPNIIIKLENLEISGKDRIEKIMIARNNLSKFYLKYIDKNNIGGNWLFLYDTDILFNYNVSIKPLIEKRDKLNGLMFLTYSIFAGYNFKLNHLIIKRDKSKQELEYLDLMLSFYYDTLALNYGDFYLKNPNKFLEGYNFKRVKTGFGGLGMINSLYYLTSYYDIVNFPTNNIKLKNMSCEHWSFGTRLNQYGNMFIISKSKSLWYQDRDYVNDRFKYYVYFYIKKKNLYNLL